MTRWKLTDAYEIGYEYECPDCKRHIGTRFKDKDLPGECPYCGSKMIEATTNADHIRSMTDEEMAVFLECFEVCHYCPEHERLENEPLLRGERCDEDCEKHMLDWLKQPYKEEA